MAWSNSSSNNRRQSLLPSSPTMGTGSSAPRRGSRAILEMKDISPALLKWELVTRIMALSLKGDWCGVDQYLIHLEKNNLELSSSEIEDNGLTPLMLAARDSKHNIVEKLLELGAVVTDRDKVSGRDAWVTSATN
ncbi:predicted protein [Nematostella vectensis]|uniref:Uncharacterized protein n=1 Tax=Nematostella vectensis TaxID=45351 RepID=A7S9C0_NEMVE|nr:predicted protein [Nematostella vectensis]|eukprot:XP_001631741.1 predicted protein [Nematostella vectensis]